WCMTQSSTKELLTPFENPKRVRCSRRKLFETPSLAEPNSPEFDQISEIKEHIEEEEVTEMAKTMEQYMSKTRGEYGSGVARPKIDANAQFEHKGQFLKELRDNNFNGPEHKDANEHIKKVLDIVDLFQIPNVTQDQIMLRAFPVSLTGATSHWLRNEPASLITTWETILDSRGAIPTKTAADAKVAIQEMAEYSQKWHNGTSSKNRSTETSDGLAAIQAQLNSLG
ncbi:hypothetical protein Tco_0897549, partial [Tanacetum coccineum]